MCKLFKSKTSITEEAAKILSGSALLPPAYSAHEGSPLLMGTNGDPANLISANQFLNSLHAHARRENWVLDGSVKKDGFIARQSSEAHYIIFLSISGAVYAVELDRNNSVKTNPAIFTLTKEEELRTLLMNKELLTEIGGHNCCVVM